MYSLGFRNKFYFSLQIVFLSVIFGLFHGLVFLPVVLALFGKSDEDGATAGNGNGDNSKRESDIEDNTANNNKGQL